MAHDPSPAYRRPARPPGDVAPADQAADRLRLDAGEAGDAGEKVDEGTLELREEELVAHKEVHLAGEVRIRTRVEEVPSRLEVDSYYEEADVEHQPIGQAVSERRDPWEEDGVLVVPVYEEQLVVTKRLILREQLRIRRIGSTQRRVFEDTLRRDRVVIEDPQDTGRVHETYATDEPDPPGFLRPDPGAARGASDVRDDSVREPRR